MQEIHGGDIYTDRRIRLDFSVNTNPLGMPRQMKERIRGSEETWERYPDLQMRRLRGGLEEFYGKWGAPLCADWFLAGNGASDLIYSLAFALRPERILLIAPCFCEYERAFSAAGCRTEAFLLTPESGFSLEAGRERLFARLSGPKRPDLLLLASPANPSGRAERAAFLTELADACGRAGTLLIVDECFVWFAGDAGTYSLAPFLARDPERFRHVILLGAFTKIFSMAGLRFGFAVCPDPGLRRQIEGVRPPWSVSGPAQEAALAAPDLTAFIRETVRVTGKERAWLAGALERLGFFVFPSSANFLLFRRAEGDETDYAAHCRKRGILIRGCAGFSGLDERYCRVAVRTRADNEALISCLEEACKEWRRQS